MSNKVIRDLRVVGNEKIGGSFFMLTLQSEDALPVIMPAQFAEVKIDNSVGTFLRRPISIHDVDYDKQTSYGLETYSRTNHVIGVGLDYKF